jgi:lipopolysaccharide transport system ATP-binding protein
LLSGQSYGATELNETIWALKGVSFEIKRGDVVGIIGRNGAGKTTLLKILSRITEPTEGYAEIRGRVGSLLEVGTGFHPELTGRENIYLNGAILGMKKAEIERKFDEIVEFAEIDKFIETPVKHYSSGMYVRLAFAVAAHLEPEILLVDEVLAVGDAAFQRKCLGKMDAVSNEGRTVLFVSHNMTAVSHLCNICIYVEEGQLKLLDYTDRVVEVYQASIDNQLSISLLERKDRSGDGTLRFTRLRFARSKSEADKSAALIGAKQAFIIVEYRSNRAEPLKKVIFSVAVKDVHGNMLFTCASRLTGKLFDDLPAEGEVVCRIPSLPLAPGNYKVNLYGEVGGKKADHIENAGKFTVLEGDFFGTGIVPVYRKHGPVLVHNEWQVSSKTEKTCKA